MAQLNQTPNQTTQIIAKSPWYEIYRELDRGAVRLVAKYIDYYNTGINAMRVVEISGDVLRVYVKWNTPERKEEEVKTVKLQPDAAAQWRNRMLSVAHIKDFKRLMWELNEAVITQAKE